MLTQALILLSDSTGDLGERFLRALISQFPKGSFLLSVHSFISSADEIERLFREIPSKKPILFHTTINKVLKKKIESLSRKRRWSAYDLTGTAMDFLEKVSKVKSIFDPDSLHELNKEYDDRIAALSFTVEHDDGLKQETLKQADIVLLGVSRTSKTPTSIYLANKGYKVANVPLVPGVSTEVLLSIRPRPKYAGLLIDPKKLRDIRLKRAEDENIPSKSYVDEREIDIEIKAAHNLFLELDCPIIDVTNRAVEEVAALVLKALGKR